MEHVPTPEDRKKVRELAKVFPMVSERFLARLMGISRNTLRKHYADDLELGRAELLAAVGQQFIARALVGTGPENKITRGEMSAQAYILSRLAGWGRKPEAGEDDDDAPGGGNVPDLSKFSPEELATYGRLSAKAAGLDPDEVIGAQP